MSALLDYIPQISQSVGEGVDTIYRSITGKTPSFDALALANAYKEFEYDFQLEDQVQLFSGLGMEVTDAIDSLEETMDIQNFRNEMEKKTLQVAQSVEDKYDKVREQLGLDFDTLGEEAKRFGLETVITIEMIFTKIVPQIHLILYYLVELIKVGFETTKIMIYLMPFLTIVYSTVILIQYLERKY